MLEDPHQFRSADEHQEELRSDQRLRLIKRREREDELSRALQNHTHSRTERLVFVLDSSFIHDAEEHLCYKASSCSADLDKTVTFSMVGHIWIRDGARVENRCSKLSHILL